MKTPEEIKDGMEWCLGDTHAYHCDECPYADDESEVDDGCGDNGIQLLEDALTLIQQREAQAPKWISVHERLPEDGVDVIIHTDFRGGYVGCGYYRIVRDAWFTSQGILLASNVLHWMPLPEPPEEEEGC